MGLAWSNLKKNRCPRCNGDFVKTASSSTRNGENGIQCKCGFFIREQRYKEIVAGMVSQDIDDDNEEDYERESF